MDEKKYDRQVELVDIGEAEELAVKMIMQEGALRLQDAVIKSLTERGMADAVTVVRETEIGF
jgi:hypothetical protein